MPENTVEIYMENFAENMKSVRIPSYSNTVTVWNICYLAEEFSDTPKISEFTVFSGFGFNNKIFYKLPF